MNVKVIKAFKDKTAGKVRWIGDVFEATEERCAEILKVGKFIEVCENKEAKEEAATEEVVDKPKKTKAKAKK